MIGRLWIPESRQLFIRDHEFGKAAIQAHRHFGEHTNDWFCKTIKSGKMESNFAIQRLRLVLPLQLRHFTTHLNNAVLTSYQQ